MSQTEASLTTGITTAGIECGRGTIAEQSVLTSDGGEGLSVKVESEAKADLPCNYNRKYQRFLPIEESAVFTNSRKNLLQSSAMGGGIYQHSGGREGEQGGGSLLQAKMEPGVKGADSNDNVASIGSQDLPRSCDNAMPFILRAEQFESIGKCSLTAVPITSSALLSLSNNNQSESRENRIVTVTVDPHGILMPTSEGNNTDSTSVMSLSGPSAPSEYLKMYYADEKPKEASMLSELYDCCWLNCDKKFFNLDDLVLHVNNLHVRVQRPDVDYQCKWDGCQRKGRGFNARYKMLIHIRTHTNEKPHNCSLCGKSFSRLENLKIHNRSHTGEKPYICPFVGCNKAYSNSSDRFKHVRTHQEEKPYICKLPGCNKRYTDPSSLRKHVRTHGHYLYDTVESSKVKHTNILTNHAIYRDGMTNQLLSFQNNIMHTPSLMSNPLLSSTIINSPITTQTTATQTDKLSVTLAVLPESPTHKVDLGQDGSILEAEGKCQDSPLDLSTSPVSLPGNSEVCADDSVNSSYTSKWDLIHSD